MTELVKPQKSMVSKRHVLVSSLLLIGLVFVLVCVFVLGRKYFNIDETVLLEWFQSARGTFWALPLTVLTFSILAFIGVPQWMLITGSVIAFGPLHGATYAWISTLFSASAHFWIARFIGAERLKTVGGGLINRIASLVRKNGFFTSLTVRLVPTGPFIVVNMAAGLSKMNFLAFFAGTALGIIPKIAAIALAGQSVLGTFTGQTLALIVVPAVLAIIAIIVMIYGRSRLLRRIPTKRQE